MPELTTHSALNPDVKPPANVTYRVFGGRAFSILGIAAWNKIVRSAGTASNSKGLHCDAISSLLARNGVRNLTLLDLASSMNCQSTSIPRSAKYAAAPLIATMTAPADFRSLISSMQSASDGPEPTISAGSFFASWFHSQCSLLTLLTRMFAKHSSSGTLSSASTEGRPRGKDGDKAPSSFCSTNIYEVWPCANGRWISTFTNDAADAADATERALRICLPLACVPATDPAVDDR